jgi:thiol-disulfide isomerase/thioredoxin
VSDPHPRARRPLGPAIGAAVLALLIAIAFAATRLSGLQGSAPVGRDVAAPELVGIDGWLNSAPRTLADLRGTVVLIDFWTYSCVNCVRTLPHLRALYETYRDAGFEIIGVHAPEFTFERDVDNVRAALARYRIEYPVALDNQMRTWDAYANRYWPHVYLIDADGIIRYDHIGEGGHEELQRRIRALLGEAGRSPPPPVSFDERGPSPNITPEVYLGARRGAAQLGTPGGHRAGATDYPPVERTTIETAPADGVFFLAGAWIAEQEYVEAARAGARVELPFFARDVFVVAAGRGSIRVELDGDPITAGAGRGLEDGVLEVRRSDLFSLVHAPEPSRHVLTLIAEAGVRLYTFTFG